MTKEVKGEVFEGRTSEMKDSPWLASEDLLGLGDVPVTIEKCLRHRNVEFDKGRKEDVVYSLVLQGKKKQLVLNSVNRKTLVAKYGTDVRDWSDKKIHLYVDQNVRFAGKTVNGIRIK